MVPHTAPNNLPTTALQSRPRRPYAGRTVSDQQEPGLIVSRVLSSPPRIPVKHQPPSNSPILLTTTINHKIFYLLHSCFLLEVLVACLLQILLCTQTIFHHLAISSTNLKSPINLKTHCKTTKVMSFPKRTKANLTMRSPKTHILPHTNTWVLFLELQQELSPSMTINSSRTNKKLPRKTKNQNPISKWVICIIST